ncbi:MAG TPA: hypothetical protein VF541_05530 [Longimicrobium sp.]
MRKSKLRLDLGALDVQSFAAGGDHGARLGTVHGHDATFCKCDTRSCDAFDTYNENNCTDTCGYSRLCETTPRV